MWMSNQNNYVKICFCCAIVSPLPIDWLLIGCPIINPKFIRLHPPWISKTWRPHPCFSFLHLAHVNDSMCFFIILFGTVMR